MKMTQLEVKIKLGKSDYLLMLSHCFGRLEF